ncbi:F0F1 ATP synthase subunit gamma [bacterium]|nr:F0F1 ATP synthase subunit gamma [bacterium]
MPVLESLKRKISSAEDLQSVVGTMKTLAAVSIHQYEDAVASLTDYFETVEEGLRMVLWSSAGNLRLSEPDRDAGTGAIVFGSDQGMCGQFNEQVTAFARDHLQTRPWGPDEPAFLVIGARASARLADAGVRIDAELAAPSSASGISSLIQEVLLRIDDWWTNREMSRVVLFYNQRETASSYRPHARQLLPVDQTHIAGLCPGRWPRRSLPIHRMDGDRLFSMLIRQYLFVTLFRACAESLVGENASRIASMQAAERNIEELLNELRTGYNQQRQTAITEELLDVVTGFEALRTTSVCYTSRVRE